MPPRDHPPAESEERVLQPLIEELDRLEDLLEEMEELGVLDRADIERRLAELNARVDELSGE